MATSDAVAAQEDGLGLAVGLSLGGCLLVAVLAAAACVWYRMSHNQQPPPSSSTRALQQVEVTVTQPVPEKAVGPQSLAALLAVCGLEHHENTFNEEGYTLDNLLGAMKQGEAVAKGDLRELKLTLGECHQLLSQLRQLGASR